MWKELSLEKTLSVYERRFVDDVEKTLGSTSRSQIRIYCIANLLKPSSMEWCDIGVRTDERKEELGFDEDPEFPT